MGNKAEKKEQQFTDESTYNIDNPFEYPFCYIGEIIITNNDNHKIYASGLLISQNCVLTNAV